MKEQFEDVACAVCDSTDLHLVTEKGQFKYSTNVCVCKSCGMSFLNPRWDEATYFDYYTNHYDALYRPPIKHKIDPKKLPGSYYPVIDRLKNAKVPLKEGCNILDVGSSDGAKLMQLNESFKDLNYYAIEPTASHKDKIKAKGIEFVSDDVNSDWHLNYQGKFDLIIMRHVMEHMLEPVKVLEKLRSVLKEGGMIYIAVPDAMNVKVGIIEYFFRVVHTYYFSKLSMANLLKKSGFEVKANATGDEYHTPELYTIAQKSEKKFELEIDSKNYLSQLELYTKEINKEKKASYQFIRNLKKSIVRLKKSVFPKPIL